MRIFLVFIITFSSASFSATQEYIRDYDYQATDYDSKYTSRINAIDGVKRELIEELGTYLNSVVNINEDSYGNKYASRDIVTITAGITQLDFLEEDWNRVRYYIKALIKADPDDVLIQVKAIRENHQVEVQLRNSLEELNKSKGLIKELKAQLEAKADEGSRGRLTEEYAIAVATIEAQQVYQRLMKAILLDDDITQEIELLKSLAGRGVPKAMVMLGQLYERGLGVDKDFDQARAWYQKAVDSGSAAGYSMMGFLYEKGFGVDQSYHIAIDYYNKAIQMGDAKAMAKLGWLYEQGAGVDESLKTAKKLYEDSLAKEPNGLAYALLGALYFKGDIGYDFDKAVSLFELGVARGNDLSMAMLGRMYFKGEGVDRDYSRALELFKRADKRGNALATAFLGIMYMQGNNVEKNPDLAFEKFKASAESGSRLGYRMLGIAYKKGIGVDKDRREGNKWLKKAAELGDDQAKKILGGFSG